MRNSIKLLGLATLAVAAFTTNANAQNTDPNVTTLIGNCNICSSASASTSAWARVVTPIAVTALEEMNFGAFCVNANSGGTAVIAPDRAVGTGDGGTITYTNLHPIFGAIAGDPVDHDGAEEARFSASGEPTLQYTAAATSAGLNGGLTLTNFTINGPGIGPGASPRTTLVFPGSGVQVLDVGATLNVPANASIGWHSGLITMTVSYN